MNIKANRPVSEMAEPVDTYNEGVEGYVEETAPPVAQNDKRTSDRVLLVLGLFLLAFIVTMIVIFCVKGSTPDVLIQCVLGAGGLEALVLAGIKVSKVIAVRDSGSDSSDGMG